MCFQIPFTFLSILPHSKIQRYSPNENAKVYDKPFTKKTEVVFNPVQALKLVQSGPPKCDDEESRKSLLLAYINVFLLFS